MEKQPEWAAPISSSGLLPCWSPKRVANEYGAFSAPLSTRSVPLPSSKLPHHSASALRIGMTRFPYRR